MYPGTPTLTPQLSAALERQAAAYTLFRDYARGAEEILTAAARLKEATDTVLESLVSYIRAEVASGGTALRRILWLYTGLQRRHEAWPLYTGRHEWAGHVFDWTEAVNERARQERRREEACVHHETNSAHSEDCDCPECIWADEAAWEAEEKAEWAASRNVFFNGVFENHKGRLFADLVGSEAFWEGTRPCWIAWDPLAHEHGRPVKPQDMHKKCDVARLRRSCWVFLWNADVVRDHPSHEVFYGAFLRAYLAYTQRKSIQDNYAIFQADYERLG
jgi:hypothetical protein